MGSKLIAVKSALILWLLILGHLKSQGQNTMDSLRSLRDSSLGVAISAYQFDSLVATLLSKFESDTSEKKIQDYLLLVKVCNTIGFGQMFESDKEFETKECKQLSDLYLHKYLDTIIKITDATVSIGYSLYSKKYDLQIGGVKTKDNFYKIKR